MAQSNLTEFIRALPKAEIHIHLEGSIQPETVLELAQRHGQLDRLPGDDVPAVREWFQFTDFPHFIRVYTTVQNFLRSAEDFALVAYENGADMARQNICYREITVTPYTHTDYQQAKGISIEDILQGLDDGRRRARDEFGVEMRWVFDCPRNLSFPYRDGRDYDPRPAERTLEYALAGMEYGVVGFGLGGYEVGAPPEPFAHAFRQAKEAGLLSVPHAGETRGPESIWGALFALDADRIGHGVRAIEDPHLLHVLKERQVPLEINPTSNRRLHVYPRLAMHPFPHLDRMGLLVTVNSDDPPFFNTALCDEYTLLAREFGYEREDLVRIARNAFQVIGADDETKELLLRKFDEWLAPD